MAVIQSQVSIPDDGTPVRIYSGAVSNSTQVNIRNTGVVTVNIGPQSVLSPPLNVIAESFDDSGGTFAAGTYFWKVTALSAYGESVGSLEAQANVPRDGTVAVTWSAVAGAATYNVYRTDVSQDEDVSPALVHDGVVATNYTDTGDAPATGAAPTTNGAQIPLLYPVKEDETLQYTARNHDVLMAQVASPGTPGEITVLTVG